jgi:beta-galactosidase
MRQNMDTDSPAYRFYAERLIRHIVAHYKDNPTVIGWQLDNETSSYDAANPDVFIGFQHYLEKKFVTPEALSKAWFLNYWGENLHTWEDLPTRDGAISPATSWSGPAGARCASPTFFTGRPPGPRMRRPTQFVTTDYGGMMKRDVNEEAIAEARSTSSPTTSTTARRTTTTARSSPLQETFPALSSTATFWSPRPTRRPSAGLRSQYPPYDGQMREDVYTHLSNGANMVEYWHWASIAANQETYWKGVLSHDLEPNRAYAEVSRTAHELEKIGPHLVGLQIHNQVAILWSRDSANAISFMPFGGGVPAGAVDRRARRLRIAGPADAQARSTT